ncbi:hypothetical protein BJ875DRAFT_540203 [Amylocarpus encephaloides]|uniref:RING-type domain-containing protein n=1 Tax=Amylocarpus encephaloides TaxID=45428 RepID=A0A9P7YRF3_9HELO|nr:hypothetical protein BJ875DRAFT_540203 [Amylocarpus encephaloides]
MATRRSPRTIQALTNGLLLKGFDSIQTAVAISLCHCTGWSADRVALKMHEVFGVKITAEEIFDFDRRWVTVNGVTVKESTEGTMIVMGRIAGEELKRLEKGVAEFERPVTVNFKEAWSPKSRDGLALCPGYTPLIREMVKSYLIARCDLESLCTTTIYEAQILHQFGRLMVNIFNVVLKEWTAYVLKELQRQRPLSAINDRKQVDTIMIFLGRFSELWESRFGLMEVGYRGIFGSVRSSTVYIASTGYGAKVLIGLFMADRLFVIDRVRATERLRIGFRLIDPADVPEDQKMCTICRDDIGTQDEDGSMTDEAGIEMVVCCGRVIGGSCLREWLKRDPNKLTNDSCPVCRHRFPPSLVQRLLESGRHVDEPKATMAQQIEEVLIDLRSPSPELVSPLARQSGQPRSLELRAEPLTSPPLNIDFQIDEAMMDFRR